MILADEFLRSVLGEASFTAPVKRRKRPKQQIGVGNDMQDGAAELDDNMAVSTYHDIEGFTLTKGNRSSRIALRETKIVARLTIFFRYR